MSTIFSNKLDFSRPELVTATSSIDSTGHSEAYTLELGTRTTHLGTHLSLESVSEEIATSLGANLSGEIPPLEETLSGKIVSKYGNRGFQSPFEEVDNLTGLDNGDTFLTLNNTPPPSRSVNGRLDFSDSFNLTRRYTYKDDYILTSPINGNIQINLDSSEFDTYLQLVDTSTGNVITFDNNSGTGTNAQLNFTAQLGEQYLIRASSYRAFQTGNYDLTAQFGPESPSIQSNAANSFDRTYGYGLVDAAAAVADAVDQPRFNSVANIGGNQWSNDLINAPEAWSRGHTGQGVTVAVIDSGVDIFHEDLRSNIWVNTDEILGDGIDNDRNGYIDDRYGWNFGRGQNNNNVLPGTSDFGQGHGTHVAGTIAAANNGIGITGVAHNADIMAIRMGDISGGSFVNGGNLAEAIRYAVDNGADVINMSLGWSDPTGSVRNALAYAASRDVITVMAAGNSGRSAPELPAQYAINYGISVGAVNASGNITGFSNRAGNDSRLHHVVAPGQSIYSTLPNNRYGSLQGTSMAAPHVAGVVALMLSANPNLTHAEVREILTETAV